MVDTPDPRNPEIQTDLGALAAQVGRLEEAETAMRQSIEIAPSNAESCLQLANALERQGKLEEAAAAARRAIELNPKWANPRVRLVRLLEQTGLATEAETVLCQAIEALPNTAGLYHERSYLLERRGDLDGAVEAASHALGLDANDVMMHVHYSQLLARQDKVEAAIEAARRAVKLRPEASGLHGHHSQLLTRAGRLDEAEVAIRLGIELAPEDSNLQLHLVRLLHRTGRQTEAEAVLRRAIDASPDTAVLHHWLSYLLGQRGEVNGGIETGRRAVALEPTNATFHSQLGHLLVRSERFGEAEDVFAEALAIAPDSAEIRQALERVRARRAVLAIQQATPEPASGAATVSDGSPTPDPVRPTRGPVLGKGAPDGTSALSPWEGKRAWELAEEGSLADLSELIDRHFGAYCRIRVEVDEGLLQLLAQWDVVGPSESRIRVGRRGGGQQRLRLHWRTFDMLPLLAAYHREGAPSVGSVMLSLEDWGIAPGLAFCDSRPGYFLIPDAIFIASQGYGHTRRAYAMDEVPWAARTPAIFWRGHDFGPDGCDWHDLPRVRLCSIAGEGTHRHLFDVGLSPLRGRFTYKETGASSLVKDIVPVRHLNRYRYHIDIDGRSSSWPGLFQKLLSGSPTLKVTSARGYRQWYYDRLNPWQHYVPVAMDMSDLVEKAEWLQSHEREARAIGSAGQALAQSMTIDTELRGSVDTVADAISAQASFITRTSAETK